MEEIESIKDLPACPLMLLLLTHTEAAALVEKQGMYLYKLNEKNCYVFVEMPVYQAMKVKKGELR